jgi:2-polyprenyl-3-methyl-5-hydroxy-6-metoxy-1,4-benzoquinol methylase
MSCPICKSQKETVIKNNCKDQYYNIEGNFSILKCKTCNFVYTNPYLTGNELFKYYPDNYAPYLEENTSKINFKNKSIIRKFRDWLFPNSPHYIPDNLQNGQNILEIGCSHGSFLNKLKIINNNLNLTGIELNEKAAKIAEGYGFELINKPFEDIIFSKKFDFIFLWMVLEHLPFPDEVISKFNNITNKNAKIIFSIPELDSIEFTLFGKYAQHVDIPRHLNYFSKNVLINIFNKHGFKFENRVKIFEPVTFIRSISIFLENKLSKNNFISNYLNQFENQPFNTIGSKFLLFLVGYPFMFIQKITNKNSRVIYVFSKQ